VKILLTVLICLSLAACSGSAIQRKDGTRGERSMSLSGIAKSDVDDVAELAQRELIASLKRLTEKLYRRNPGELRKNGAASLEEAVDGIFKPVNHWHLSSRRTLDWQASLNRAFDAGYTGDRVEALMKGLLSMSMASYNHKTEVYLLDSLDPQKLYNAARNLEIAAWRLSDANSQLRARVRQAHRHPGPDRPHHRGQDQARHPHHGRQHGEPGIPAHLIFQFFSTRSKHV